MIYSTNMTNPIECHKSGKHKANFERFGPVLKKLRKKNLAPQNVDNCKVAESQDRLSDLPDCLIHHILSFMETKDAIRTCVLSKGWRYLWTSIPCLNFSSKSFSQLTEFREFVTWVLSHHDSSHIKVLIYCHSGVDYATDQSLLSRVIEYAVERGVEEIRINLCAKSSRSLPIEIPFSLFACQSLKRLLLKDCHPTNVSKPLGCKSLKMLRLEHFLLNPAVANSSNPFASLAGPFGFTMLTTLHLSSFTLSYTGIDHWDPFADCVYLKNLLLSDICFKSDLGPKDFLISAPQLNNLTLMCNRFKCKLVVATPQLTNFSYLYSTPGAFFEFSLPSLDDLIIDIHEQHNQSEESHWRQRGETLHGLINMLHGHHDAEAVKLSFRTVVADCGTTALLKHECPSSSKLKSLSLGLGSTYKIYIVNFDHITAYFRNFSQSDFEIATV